MINRLIWVISLWLWTANRQHTVAANCPVICEWLSWEPWDNCSSACGGGYQLRHRAACCDASKDVDYCIQNCDAITEDGFSDERCCAADCFNGGTFQKSSDSCNGSCQCRTGYSGTCCEQYVCDTSAPCSNNGVCVPVSETEFNCECNVGFTGGVCETNIDECISDPCQNGGTCVDGVNGYTCTCVPGYTDIHCETDINECENSPCENGGNCTDFVNRYTCQCSQGYSGGNCEIDIDECASNPCQNGATCRNMIARFYCQCASGWYDVLCDRDVCRPVPADVLFILDSSVSMTEQEFKKQLEFIKHFTDGIRIGPQDFQISIITFSFEAKIEFYLNDYTTNATLKTAIDRIQYVPGPTYTNKALDLAKQMFSASKGAGPQTFGEGQEDDRRNPESIVYLLTDGMSTLRDETKLQAKELKKVVNRVFAIGIGPQVSHQELTDIASEPTASSDTNVFSVSNFDSLFTLVKRLVKLDCKACSHSAASDVTVFVDTSGSLTRTQFRASLEAMKHFVSQVPLGPDVNDTHVEAFTFGSAVHRRFGFLEHNDTNQLQNALQSINFVGTGKADFSEVMNTINIGTVTQSNHARNETDARRFVVIFTNGKIDLEEKQKFEAEKAKLQDRVTFIAIGAGEEVSVEGLLGLATDPYHVFYIAIDPDDTRTAAVNMDSLKALQNEFAYNTCD